MKKILLGVCLISCLSSAAYADSFYAIGNIGQTEFATGEKKSDFGFGLGFNLTENIAFEYDYRNLGTFYDTTSQSVGGPLTEKDQFSASQLSALIKFPISSDLSYLVDLAPLTFIPKSLYRTIQV